MAGKRDKIGWEKRFPALDDTWTHWWLECDGKLIGVIKGSKLVEALKIVEDYYESGVSIKAYVARVDFDGQIIPDKKRRWEIAHNWELERKIKKDKS